jgi:hypothetical protein
MRVHIYRFFLLRDREKHRAFSKIARARPIPEPHARTKKSVKKEISENPLQPRAHHANIVRSISNDTRAKMCARRAKM